jgi:hypothetical protein
MQQKSTSPTGDERTQAVHRTAPLAAAVAPRSDRCVQANCSDKTESTIKMPDQASVESHQLSAYEVRGNWIIGGNDLAEAPSSSVQASVALHGDNANRDNEADQRRAQISRMLR